jgi:hypothetical protein
MMRIKDKEMKILGGKQLLSDISGTYLRMWRGGRRFMIICMERWPSSVDRALN